MKKKAVFVLLCAACAFCFAQVSTDPTDDFYRYAQMWENRGLVDVPPFRPYPLANIKAILQTVMENGAEPDKEVASELYEKITGKPWKISVEANFFTKREQAELAEDEDVVDSDKMISLYPAIEGDAGFRDDFLSFGYHAGLAISNATDTDFMPLYQNSWHDAIFDATEVGPIDMYLDVNTAVAVGYEHLYFQGGLYRTGYSAFLNEGLSLNDTSYHSGNLSFTYFNDRVSYAQIFSMIGATSSYDGDLDTLSPDKIMAFHAIGYELFDFLKVSFYESAIYGGRTDLSYVLPVPYMVAQGIGGASDNLSMGLLIDIKPAPGVLWETDIMADDFPVEDFMKLDFDSKYRLALKSGFIYTPANSFMERFSMSYTAVLPYTYTHWQYDSDSTASISSSTINYQNGTNSGVLMGSQLGPNSDAVNFGVDIRAFKRLTISIDAMYARHANVCETLDTWEAITYLCADKGVYSTDGSVYTHANFADSTSSSGNHVDSAWDALNWLNQDHVQYTIQSGITLKYDLKPTRKGTRVTLNAGFTAEYIHNYGVTSEMFPGESLTGVYDEESGDLVGFYDADGTYIDDIDGEEASAIVESYKESWAAELVDQFTLYFNFGVTIKF